MATVKVEGLDGVLKRLDNVVDEANVTQALEKACLLVEGEARKKAPKGDGALRRSIESKVEAAGGNYTGVVFTPLEYAPYVEYGTGLFAESGGRQNVPWCYKDDEGKWHTTSGMKPQPYLRPALNENREEILKILKEGVINND